jgi:hypothetical protein
MGLPWVQISHAVVLDDTVAVQIVATDEDPEPGTGAAAPDSDNGSDADSRAPTEGKI